ncbi:MAG: alkaline phosphatase family protein [Lutisporaceae bacterium]
MSRKVIWLVWDAASMDIVEKLLKEDKLPNLKSLKEEGTGLRMRLNQPNCQTPAALAVLFTGMPSEQNGVAGFYTPDISKEQNLLSLESSFHQNEIHKHSIWNRAASNGKTVSLVHVPFVGELEENERASYRIAIDGYRKRLTRGKVFTASTLKWSQNEACAFKEAIIEMDGFSFNIQLYNQGLKQAVNIIYSDGIRQQVVNMEVGTASIDQNHSFTLGKGTKLLVSALYKPYNRDEILFIFSGIYQVIDHKGSDIEEFLDYSGAFEGEGFGRYYRKGIFGKTFSQGGQGEAEAIFMKLLNRTAIHFEKAGEFCIKNYPADLTVLYQPCIDEMSHEFIGFCDKNCELYDKKYYDGYWENVTKAYQMADRHLGAVMKLLPEDTYVVISSDHGMAAVSRVFYINELLRRSGMLEFDSEGTVDMTKTKVFFHPADNGSIFVNTDDHKDGIVPQAMKQAVLDSVINTLESLREPETGRPIIKGIRRMYEEGTSSRELFGDIFVEPSYGYCLKGDMNAEVIERTNKSGYHHYNPDFSSMDGIFFVSEHNQERCGTIQNTEVFAVLCGLMNIPL